MQRIHFIAIGGSAMHNIAIELKELGIEVSGSDDEIFEPSRSRLEKAGLLPEKMGWFTEKINEEVGIVILGMHAKADNPELLKAQELGIIVVSYPEFLYHVTKKKKRIVITGSHGKTTTTAMIMHVLKSENIPFDYMIGSQVDGFDNMVGLFSNSNIAVLEGDEYLSSAIDKRSKFLWYQPDIAVITGIAWDHINVFPTIESYVRTFIELVETMPEGSTIYWSKYCPYTEFVIDESDIKAETHKYSSFCWEKEGDGQIYVQHQNKKFPVKIFGNHNFQNLCAAYRVCMNLDISEEAFFSAISTFKGAKRRLELIKEKPNPIYYDFAHAPSKVWATVNAVRKLYPDKKITACLELHTFSSIDKDFIPQYKDTLNDSDLAYIYLDPEVMRKKCKTPFSHDYVIESFNHKNIHICTSSELMFDNLKIDWLGDSILLIMSSGNLGGIDPVRWANEL